MSKTDIRSLTYEELSEKLSELNLPKFRTAQIYSWLYEKGVTSFDEMTNLSKDLRAVLSDNFEIKNCRIDLKQVSKLDGTVKYLYELDESISFELVSDYRKIEKEKARVYSSKIHSRLMIVYARWYTRLLNRMKQRT